MTKISCGIDFGTSNSSVAIDKNGHISLVPVEQSHVTIPSAIFFRPVDNKAFFGRTAIDLFFDRQEGRFMRSLKRVLGTSLMKHGTVVNGATMNFASIITSFLRHIKEKADAVAGQEIDSVVMGRPVHFVDNDPDADARAQAELTSIAQRIGFKHIDFQFEPIAAAFAHEVHIQGEKLAIVVDLGGGTSDFTVIKLSNQYLNKADRTSDILANTGVRIGGNDFDKQLSLSAIMPELGYRSTYGAKHLEVPLKPFHDLAEWSKVNFLYTPKLIMQTRQLLHESHDKKRYNRLLQVLVHETGHTLLAAAEKAKIALSAQEKHQALFDFIEDGFSITIGRERFEEAIQDDVEKIAASAKECLQQAGVTNEAIDLVILTGGSTEVHSVQVEFKRLFPNAAIADENKLSSVGLGLAYDSQHKFGSPAITGVAR
ncbi:Hsp70 family protein [Spirosoma utsteinense]|uniref:Chaperone protein n=1 Tax=Spirosoma utsteinense TaxID=2585773 RepID=A0ABR6VZB1_9BACT|nr:Hsp70 family protein [Spirosoma utsteinense]MBC3784703.1 putative chaperone protein [Spirosoma utsteinense]MBC3789543.1 putative chaperone protein [Spirosoma utsteinense]